MVIEVSPSDLVGRVQPHVRRAIWTSTAVPSPAMRIEGDMAKLLAERDRVGAVQQGFHMMSTDALKAALQDRLEDRESELYRKSHSWSEHVEDLIDDLEVEIERRDAQSRIGL